MDTCKQMSFNFLASSRLDCSSARSASYTRRTEIRGRVFDADRVVPIVFRTHRGDVRSIWLSAFWTYPHPRKKRTQAYVDWGQPAPWSSVKMIRENPFNLGKFLWDHVNSDVDTQEYTA